MAWWEGVHVLNVVLKLYQVKQIQIITENYCELKRAVNSKTMPEYDYVELKSTTRV